MNLAIALKLEGLRVGLLDADVYGPSQPRMLGVSGKPPAVGGDMVAPLENYGIKLMSMGLLVPDDTAMIWRGPMVQSALTQMLNSVAWGELDVIVIDLPPGTGDIQISRSAGQSGRGGNCFHTTGYCPSGCCQSPDHV